MATSTPLTERLEDYLEAIHAISKERKVARSKEIASRLGVHNSSVTSALQVLSERGLVNYAPYEYITLTPAGMEAAEEVQRKHEILRTFLTDVLCVDDGEAEANAHRMEHVVSDEVLDRLVAFVEYVESCPREISQWQGDRFLCTSDPESEACRDCDRPYKRNTERNGTDER
jgi:DtxR family transcriptional regulator, Mn-dependent transcriptional regulator